MSKDRNNKKGFTLAEVLITLTIIGVVAALTIPSLLANVSDKTYDAKRKGFTTRMAQAISQIGTITAYEAVAPTGSTETDYAIKHSSMNFITEALSKSFKIATMCEYNKLDACDFPKRFGMLGSAGNRNTGDFSQLSTLGEKLVNSNSITFNSYGSLFKTKNGESVFLWYNPKCTSEQEVDLVTNTKYFAKEVCVNIFYDLDGAKKGPNKVGKDMGFMLVLYADSPYVYTPALLGGIVDSTASKASYGSNNATNYCQTVRQIDYKPGPFILPSKEYLYSIALNCKASNCYNYDFWTTSVEGSSADDYAWVVNSYEARAKKILRSTSSRVGCILPESN